MLRTRILAFLTGALCLLGAASPALAAQTDCDSVYCFTAGDFSREENMAGICLTDLPGEDLGVVMLNGRVLRPGDILTSDQLSQITFVPVRTEEDLSAQVTYLPIYEDHVAPEATLTIGIRGKEDKAPIAEDSALETYKNLAIDGRLKVKDPEEQAMTFALSRAPRRGQVEIREDGSFTYTPRKNKVGTDSFTYTATDPAGNVSREATVTIQILKPSDAPQYTDTLGRESRFAAEWMKHTGIFVGEQVVGNACFYPDKPVSRGEFLTMLVKALELPPEEDATITGYTDEIPAWLRPYLAAAIRSGLTAGLPNAEVFGAQEPITGPEAAVLLQNALDLTVPEDSGASDAAPVWARNALAVMEANGICLGMDVLTREQAALCLYQVSQLAPTAPGMAVLRSLQ